MKVHQAYRFALEPTPAQECALRSHAGAARFAWNWGLAKCKERYEAEGKWYSGFDLQKLWNVEKKIDPALAWWSENSKWVYQYAFLDLDRALRDFIKSKKGERKGRRLGFPKFKKRGRCRDSFRFSADRPMACAGTMVTLPRLGAIRTYESTRKLARRLENGTARILSATVARTAQRWFVSFTVEVDRAIPDRHARPGSAIGVDLGVKTLLVGVDDAGNVVSIAGPKPLREALRKLQRASRAHSRKRPGSANRRKHADALARIHARVASIRSDALRKATTGLALRYEIVVAEDLNVAGIVRNRRLSRAVADQGFGQVRRMLGYKTTWNGGQLILADRWFPSSKTCSSCEWRKPSLTLAERTFTCEACGLVIDRDENAARNLLKLAASGAESQNACGGTVRPRLARHVPAKQEPGTALAGQTGTASGQPLATGKESENAALPATVDSGGRRIRARRHGREGREPMTETKRIRWNDDEGSLNPGQSVAGVLGPFSFGIGWMSGSEDWRLYSELPGMGFRSARNADLGALKAEAERWLEEFASSLGAIFPAPPLPASNRHQHLDLTCGACGEEFGTNCADDDIRCAVCSAHRCPHCGGWFGED